MQLVCALSGEVPQEPVVSAKSGAVFEKRIIEKYLAENGQDPTSGETLSEDELIPLKGAAAKAVAPRPPNGTNLPALLKLFQNEWDATVLETYTLQQKLDRVRQELAHALYQQDAATRVIARLVKERDEARNAIATLAPGAAAAVAAAAPAAAAATNGSGGSGPSAMDTSGDVAGAGAAASGETPGEEGEGITEAILGLLQATSARLSKGRKKRPKPADWCNADVVKGYGVVSSHPGIHSASSPGIRALDLHVGGDLALTGGVDKKVCVFSRSAKKTQCTLKGHTKAVNDVCFHPAGEDLAVTCSDDKTVRLYSFEGKGECKHTIKTHSGAVTGVSFHATGQYIASSSADKTVGFSNLRNGKMVTQLSDPSHEFAYTCLHFHPDGLILAAGCERDVVRIWDVRSAANVANFEGHNGAVTSVCFSENGYYLATAADGDETVKLWDLRKLTNFKTLEVAGTPNSVAFDSTGAHLAVASSQLQVFNAKTWECFLALNEHSAPVTRAKFGPSAAFLASVSLDRSLKFYGTP